jgi:hypothetical protein
MMRRSGLALLVLALLPTAATAQTVLQGRGLAPPPPAQIVAPLPAPVEAPQAPIDERIAFNSTERWLIQHYFEQVREKQKRAARLKVYERVLPVGLSDNPGKGQQLSPATLADLRPLPPSLVRQLPPERPGTRRLIAGQNVLMVQTASGTVLDILDRVVF